MHTKLFFYDIKDKDIANHIYTSLPATTSAESVQNVAKAGNMVKSRMVLYMGMVRNMVESKRVVEMREGGGWAVL